MSLSPHSPEFPLKLVGCVFKGHPAARAGLLLTGYLVVALLVALPILVYPFLPLVDLPNHIARHHIAVSEGGPLARYYTYHLALAPNSAADRAFILFGSQADPIRFSQWAMAAYAVSLVAASMLLSRVLWRRWSVWPLAAALVVFNASFYWGFQNFLLSVPVAVAALGLWLLIEDRPVAQRLLMMVPIAGLIYVLHFYAFAFFGIAAFGREVQRVLAAGPDRLGQLCRGLAMALPFVLPLIWLVTVILTSPPSPAGSPTFFGTWQQRLDILRSIALGPTDSTILGVLSGGLTFAFLSVLLLFSKSVPGRPRLVLASPILGPVIAVAVAAAVAPFHLNGVAYSNIRLPFVLVLMLIAGSRWENLSVRWTMVVGSAVLALLVARGAAFVQLSAMHNAEMRDLSTTLEALPPGSRLFPVTEDLDPRLWHVQAYAVTQRDAFVPTLFQGVHDLEVLPEWANHSNLAGAPMPLNVALAIAAGDTRGVPSEGFWGRTEFPDRWPEKFTHVLLVGPAEGSASALPSWLRPVSQSGRFSMYEIARGE